jgi:hypothetical protein
MRARFAPEERHVYSRTLAHKRAPEECNVPVPPIDLEALLQNHRLALTVRHIALFRSALRNWLAVWL